MTIFRNTLKRILRSKVQLIFILLFPLAFMSISFIDGEIKTKVAIIDHDRTELTSDLRTSVATKATLVDKVVENEIEDKLMGLQLDYVILIDKGFTDRLIKGEPAQLRTYSVKESNASIPIRTLIDQWVHDARLISAATNHEAEQFYVEFGRYNELGALQLEKKSLVDEGRGKPRITLGYLVMSMLYTSVITALVILMNKHNYTLYRTLIAPVRMRSYMLQIIISFLVISVIQIIFVLLVLKFGFGMFPGTTLLSIFLLLLIYSLVSVSFGVLISSWAKNIVQAVFIGISTIPPLAMLGGAYFPLDYASDTVKTMSQFSPVSWILGGIEKILRGQDFVTVSDHILILLLFAVVFFLLGSIRKVDIAK